MKNAVLIYCPACENACSEKAPTCPKCGQPLKSSTVEPIEPKSSPVDSELADLLRRIEGRVLTIELTLSGITKQVEEYPEILDKLKWWDLLRVGFWLAGGWLLFTFIVGSILFFALGLGSTWVGYKLLGPLP